MVSKKSIFLAIVLAVGILFKLPAGAADSKTLFFAAEKCYNELKKSKKRRMYRDQWMICIERFALVYKTDPGSPWAPAGMYMAGKLYTELYKLSKSSNDRKEAIDIYERVVKRYPSSRYAKKALKDVKRLLSPKAKVVTSAKASLKSAAFKKAFSCYKALKKDPKRQKYRDQWDRCIKLFEDAGEKSPGKAEKAKSLFMAAFLNLELGRRSKNTRDFKRALDLFNDYKKEYPRGADLKNALAYAAEAEKELIRLGGAKKRVEQESVGKLIFSLAKKRGKAEKKGPEPKKTGKKANGELADVTGLRFWSNPSYTRVVVDADRETTYTHRLLKQDPSLKKPQRLLIDLEKSRLTKDIPKFLPIDDNMLMDARAGQYRKDSVRIVIDIKSFDRYKVFSLKNPFRIVVDVWGEEPAVSIAKKNAAKKIPKGALTKQLALGVKRVVIDPGHGGKDYGAPGYLKGVHEKDIVLKIASLVAKKIKKRLGFDVIMTRKKDRYLTLEERTAIANTKNADLFISIHTNSHRDKRAFGIETYFLNLATDEDAIRVAALENATSAKNISDLQTILTDLMQNAKINESSRLATLVQGTLCSRLKKHYSRIKDKGVKQAPFYVLLGAQMPAILIETSFISNSRECRRLVSRKFQERVADAIVDGIEKYAKELNPMAGMVKTVHPALRSGS